MADKPKQPAIPAVPNDVSPSMRNFMTAIREVLQVQAGQGRGSELDKAVTFRDLGLTTGMGSSTAMMGRVLNNLVQNGELVTQQAVERPTTPTGVSVSAFVGGIAISWDNPRYSGHAYTEVFAQPTMVNEQEQPIDPPELNTETMLLGTAASPLLGVQARTLFGYYIWVRHVNRLGQVGPVHAALGTFLYLPPSPSFLLEQLTNEITRDQLSVALQQPIDLVPTLQTAITTEQTTRANADTALSSSISTVSAVANAKIKTYRQSAAPSSGMTAGDLWFDTDDNNKTYRYSGSAWTATDDTRIAANAAAIIAEQTARANADSAMASNITTVQAVLAGDTSNLFLNPTFLSNTHGFSGQPDANVHEAAYQWAPAGCPAPYYLEIWNRDVNGKTIPVVPGEVYHFSMSCATGDGGAPPIGIGCMALNASGGVMGYFLVAHRYDATAEWKRISGEMTVPSGCTQIRMWVQLDYFRDATHNHWWAITGVQWTNANATKTLSASVQTNATAIANLDGTYTAQWSAKTQVGDLVGGFGTFNDGTTTRFTVHANRFAIMDSSLGNQRFVPFVVDNGKTVISDAFIRNAYIEQLAAGQITAAKINSLTLNAINITGGTLSLGTWGSQWWSFQEGGNMGIGGGGPYGAWGYGWNTMIWSDGTIQTNRLYASGGSFTGTVNANAGTFNNVTIAESCDVRGTVYANKIVGDVVAFRSYPAVDGGVFTYTGQTITPISFVLNSAPFERKMALVGASASITGSPSGGGGWIRLFVNGAVVCGDASNVTSRNLSGVYTIPANTKVSVSVQVSLHSWYNTCHAFATIEMVAVYKESGGTFA